MTSWDDNAIRDTLAGRYTGEPAPEGLRLMDLYSRQFERLALRAFGGCHWARSVRRWRRDAWGRSRRIHAGPR